MSGPSILEVDLHVHSEASYDGHEPVELILEHAADIDLDVISASLEAAERAPEYGLIGIPGGEVSTADGHLLGIGIEELPPAGRPVGETIAAVREAGGGSGGGQLDRRDIGPSDPPPHVRVCHGVEPASAAAGSEPCVNSESGRH